MQRLQAQDRAGYGRELSDDEAMNLADKVINYYKAHAKKQRLGEFIDEIGFDKFKAEVV